MSAAWILSVVTLCAAPQQSGPLGTPPTGAEVELGKQLFFDPLLSQDGTVSCSTCHNPRFGWSDGRSVAVGIRGQSGTRNSPTIINASYGDLMFWDGRTVGLTTQALLPLSNPIEMGQQTEGDVLLKLRLTPKYVAAFSKVYGVDLISGSPVTGPRLARALAAFESTVVSFHAPIDKYLDDGIEDALTPEAKIGWQIFQSSGCVKCHTPPLFTDNLFHNNGMEHASKLRVTDQGRSQVFNRQQQATLFRQGVSPNVVVRAFKTPTLREIQDTAPYNHAGNFLDIDRVITHYSVGGAKFDGTTDPYIDPAVFQMRFYDWSESRRRYLKIFLLTALNGTGHEITEPLP